MNYFDQLIESYALLKQRKFQINEAGKYTGPELDPQAIAQAEGAIQKLGPVKDSNWTVEATGPKKLGRKVVGLGPFGSANFVDKQGIASNRLGDLWAEFVNHFSSGETKTTKGEVTPTTPLQAAGLATRRVLASLSRYTENAKNAAKMLSPTEQLPFEANTYVNGNSSQSLERKMATAKGVVLEKDGPIASEIDAELVEGAMGSARWVSDLAMGKIESPCSNVSDHVKQSGTKLVFLHENDSSRGIAITPSRLDLAFVDRIKKQCGPIEEITKRDVGTATGPINSHRGGTIEELDSLIGMSRAMEAKKESLGEKFTKFGDFQKERLRKIFGKNIALSKAAFSWALQSQNEGVELQAHLHARHILEAGTDEQGNHYFGTPQGVRTILSKVGRLGKKIRGLVPADIKLKVGKETGGGKKADIAMGFVGPDGEKRAKKVAKKLGVDVNPKTWEELSVDDPEIAEQYKDLFDIKSFGSDEDGNPIMKDGSNYDPVWVIGNSMKAYLSFDWYKSGEQNGIEKFHNNILGNGIPEEFFEKIKEEIGFGKNGVPSLEKVQKYAGKLSKIDKMLDTLVPFDDSSYVEKGKVKSVNPQDALSMLKNKLVNNSSYETMKESELLKIISEGDPPKLLDLSDQKTRTRVKEQLSRLLISAQIHTDLNAGGEREKVARASQAFNIWNIAGASEEEIADLREVETNTGYVIRHNDPVREAAKGILDGSWNAKQANYTQTWVGPDNKQVSVSRSRTQGDAGNAITRTEVKFSRECIEANDISEKPSAENTSTLLKYIKGQQKLLEELEQECSL